MAKKPVRHAERLEIYYDRQHWQQLKMLRSEAAKIMDALEKANLITITYGSIARGDVTAKSDVDIFLPNPPSSFTIEGTLERAGIQINRRLIVQATPYYAVKGYIEIGEQKGVSFPLVKMRRVERDFYRFGGEIALTTLEENKRVAGVDKRLMLIEPIERGHIESSIIGREEEIAKLLRISLETVLDRVRALLRRDKIGRTGVFIEKELAPDETFEMALKRLVETRPEVRRRLKFCEK
ncbi:MAG: nucleotidyltransferase domain-containing protein [Candidatus Bathyarchaeota archaeon]|nr:nucleotidyltransferase domain-containing protein [Candidatus Bathyarchaeota archaeon]